MTARPSQTTCTGRNCATKRCGNTASPRSSISIMRICSIPTNSLPGSSPPVCRTAAEHAADLVAAWYAEDSENRAANVDFCGRSCGRLRKPCLKRHPARHVLREVPRNRPSDSLETALPKGASMKLAAKGAYAAWLTEGSESRTANGDFRGQSYGRFRESDYIQVTLRSNIRTTPKNRPRNGVCAVQLTEDSESCAENTRGRRIM